MSNAPANPQAPGRSTSGATPPSPWWKHGHMWMVVGGPLIVVVASFITLYLAISRPDPVYSDGGGPGEAGRQQTQGRSDLVPAVQARNHAATGGMVQPANATNAQAAH